jgi:hypothetical protein
VTRTAWTMSGFSALMLAFVTLVTQTQVRAQTTTGPTAAGASSTDEAINQALLTGNADALKALLADDWTVVSGFGSVVTTHLDAAGPFVKEVNGKLVRKCFAVKERQTDVLLWKHGGWESVLLHETVIPPGPKVGDALSACT